MVPPVTNGDPLRASDGGLEWAVRDTFVHYVLTVAGGTCAVEDGAVVDDDTRSFRFPVDAARSSAHEGRWTLAFGGAVLFVAHRGLLSVRIGEPEVTFTHEGGFLTIADPAAGGRTAIAVMDSAPPQADGELLTWSGMIPRLTAEGSTLFGASYAVGTPMAPMTASVRSADLRTGSP